MEHRNANAQWTCDHSTFTACVRRSILYQLTNMRVWCRQTHGEWLLMSWPYGTWPCGRRNITLIVTEPLRILYHHTQSFHCWRSPTTACAALLQPAQLSCSVCRPCTALRRPPATCAAILQRAQPCTALRRLRSPSAACAAILQRAQTLHSSAPPAQPSYSLRSHPAACAALHSSAPPAQPFCSLRSYPAACACRPCTALRRLRSPSAACAAILQRAQTLHSSAPPAQPSCSLRSLPATCAALHSSAPPAQPFCSLRSYPAFYLDSECLHCQNIFLYRCL